MSDLSEEEEVQAPLSSNPILVDKYKYAADIANKAISFVITQVRPGASVLNICQAGDDFIKSEAEKTCRTKKFPKGISFPTCISVNNIVANFSPLVSDPPVIINEGDVVKIDLGAHVDGVISQVGHTVIATAAPGQPTTGKKADVICAAHYAAEAALRLLRPGNTASQITNVVKDISTIFGVNPVAGFNSVQIDRYQVDGKKAIPNATVENEKVEDVTFEVNEVYVLDILLSTGDGKAKELDTKTTVYTKTENIYNLKLKASRYVYGEISKQFNKLPFTLRALDENRARLGITECLKHELVKSYPVVYEKEGEFVAQFKFTALILAGSTQKINGPFALPYVTSQYNITDPAILSILNQSLKRKNKKKKKSKKPAPAETGTSADAMDTQ